VQNFISRLRGSVLSCVLPRTGSSQIAGAPVLRPLACRADSWPLEVKLVAGHSLPRFSSPGTREGVAAGSVPTLSWRHAE
jgi:hypothetical protein